MADIPKKLVTVVRIIEYNGTEEWIQAVANKSRVPFTGELKDGLPTDCFIRSGVVEWGVREQVEQVDRPVIPLPPGSRTN